MQNEDIQNCRRSQVQTGKWMEETEEAIAKWPATIFFNCTKNQNPDNHLREIQKSQSIYRWIWPAKDSPENKITEMLLPNPVRPRVEISANGRGIRTESIIHLLAVEYIYFSNLVRG